jgi:hypothetical protein
MRLTHGMLTGQNRKNAQLITCRNPRRLLPHRVIIVTGLDG